MEGLLLDRPEERFKYIRLLSTMATSQQLRIIKKLQYTKPNIGGEAFKKQGSKHIYLNSSALYDIAKERKIKHEYKVEENSPIIIFVNDDPVLSLNWHFYKTNLILIGKGYLVQKYNLDQLMYSYEELAELVESVFVSGSIDYTYIVGINTLYGWKPMDDEEILVQKLKAWVNNDFEPVYNGSPEEFTVRFREKIKQILWWRDDKLPMDYTIDEYCDNLADTGTSGSGWDPDGPMINIEEDGYKSNFNKNKYARSAAYSSEQKKKILFAKTKQKANVSTKIEFYPKVRLIVASDFKTSLKMRCVDKWLRQWFNGNDMSTLFQTKEQTWDMWVRFATMNGIHVPIDQSKFDHMKMKKHVLIVLEELRDLIRDKCPNGAELVEIMETLIYALDGGKIYFNIKGGKLVLEYKSGILSGWQWTAFIDTIFSRAEFMLSLDICKDNGIDVKVKEQNFQGDDVNCTVENASMAYALISAYAAIGLIVHPKKCFISNTHNEYLRRYSSKGVVNGYPARMVNNMLWVYPGQTKQHDTKSKLSATTSTWVKFAERMYMDTDQMMPQLRRDLRGQKIAVAIIEAFLTTRKTYGGAGLLKGKDYLINTEQVSLQGRVRMSSDKGYQDFHSHFGVNQSREMEQWFLQAVSFKPKDKDEEQLYIKPQPEVKPMAFQFIPSLALPKTTRSESFPPNVIFGKSREFMEQVFPNVDTFVSQSHAPKSWIYDYLTGRVKTVTPMVPGLSEEFSALIWGKYEASIIQAMYHKRMRPDKWKGLNLYAEENFGSFIRFAIPTMPRMY